MTPSRVVLVAGTDGWEPDSKDWFTPGSPFVHFLTAHGVAPVFGARKRSGDVHPFIWSTELGGFGIGRRRLRVWEAAGCNLYDYIVPPLAPERRLPPHETNLIAHSHGLQVVLFACAAGLQVNTLISVGSPIREDMAATAAAARRNIGLWIHIHSDASDRWQWLGELFDGHLGIVRESPLADRNDFVPGVGHAGLLTQPEHFHYWQDRGWLHAIDGTVSVAALGAPAT